MAQTRLRTTKLDQINYEASPSNRAVMTHSVPEEAWRSQLEFVGGMLAPSPPPRGGATTHLSCPLPTTQESPQAPFPLLQLLTRLYLAPCPSPSLCLGPTIADSTSPRSAVFMNGQGLGARLRDMPPPRACVSSKGSAWNFCLS